VSRNAADHSILRLAALRHGVLTTEEMRRAGWSRHVVADRVARGWLTRVHRGVFVVGPIRDEWVREAAALAACGPASTLGLRSAAALAEIREPDPGPADIWVPTTSTRVHTGIRVHRGPAPAPSEITQRHGLRMTTVERTLLDLAGELGPDELDRALNEALVRHLVTVPMLVAYLARAPRRRGASTLRALLHDHTGITRSAAEEALHALIAKAGIAPARRNVRVAGLEVDAYWPELGLVIEVDSASFHGTPHAFQADREKEAAVTATGRRLVRMTRFEIVRKPEATVARLARETSRPAAAVATASRLP
jgi:predicted transcriptional regulator of viral defense system